MDLPSPPNPGVGCSRYCAALKADIPALECRAKRGSRVACPPECSYFPFGVNSHDRFFRLEGAWTTKAIRYILQTIGRARFDQLIREGALLADNEDPTTLESGLSHAIHYGLAFEKNPEGDSLADSWMKTSSLTNDEQVMTQFRRGAFVTVIQIQQVIDHQNLLGVDAFAPDQSPFVLLDQAMAAHAAIGSRLLSWLTHYPHFSRLGTMAREIPPQYWQPWRQAVEALFEKDRVREPKLAWRAWLSRRAGTCTDLLDTLSSERKETVSSNDFSHKLTAYALESTPDQLLAVLGSNPEFEPRPAAKAAGLLASFLWVRNCQGAPPARLFFHDGPEDGIGPLGNVHLYADRLILETFTEAKLAVGIKLLGEQVGPLIRSVPNAPD